MAVRLAATLVLLAWAWGGAAAQGARPVAGTAPGALGRPPAPIVFPPAGLKGPASIARPDALNAAGGPLSVRVEPRQPLGRATAALRGVASRLQRLVGAADGAGNLLMSPLSVAAALGQLLLGARGETRALLADLLDAPGPTKTVPKVSLGGEVLIPDLEYHQQFKALLDLLAADDAPASSVELRIASAFFAQRGLPLRTDFQHALHDLYQADVRSLDFRERPEEAAAQVNEWARRATRGRIPTVLAQPLPPSTAALVASAVYFRGAWAWPFDPELTVNGWFRLDARRRVATKFMRSHFTEVAYYDAPGLGYRLVVLPYKGGQTAMYVMLPDDKEADLRTFASSISLDGMMAAARAARPQTLTLILPRMNIAGSFSLKEPLSNLRRTLRLRRTRRSSPGAAPSTPAQESTNHILIARSEPRARAVDAPATPSAESPNTTPELTSASSSTGSAPSSGPAPFTSDVSQPNSPPSPPSQPAPNSPSASPPAPLQPYFADQARPPSPPLPNVPSNPSTTTLPPYVSPVVQPSPTPAPAAETTPAGGASPAPAVEMQMSEGDGAALNPLAVGSQGAFGVRPRPTAPGAFADVDLDLTGASNQTLRVSDALHHVWLEVTETGTEAVAITTTLVDYSGAEQLVAVNRPFLVAIVHEPSEALLFWAAVNDPTGGAGIRTDVPQAAGAGAARFAR